MIGDIYRALECRLPEGVKVWESPGIAPQGYVDAWQGARVFPVLDDQGNPTSRLAIFLTRERDGMQLALPVEVETSASVEEVSRVLEENAAVLLAA